MDGTEARIGVAVSRFNPWVTSSMKTLALNRLKELGVKDENLTVLETPGAFELPLMAKRLAEREDVDGVLLLGAVIQGETAHFEHIARAAADGVLRASLDTGKPVIFGILTTYNVEQAIARIDHATGYADTVVEMVNLCKISH